jgi:heat-inducible transcriptional repressor
MDCNPAAFIPSGPGHDDWVWIGGEHPHTALSDCSVIQSSYRDGQGGVGQVALVGPMRMAYATARAAVQCVAKHLNHLLS